MNKENLFVVNIRTTTFSGLKQIRKKYVVRFLERQYQVRTRERGRNRNTCVKEQALRLHSFLG